MSEFGGGTDVQQIRVIAPVVITVLPCSANSCPSRTTSERQLCSITGRSHQAICTTEIGQNTSFTSLLANGRVNAVCGHSWNLSWLPFLCDTSRQGVIKQSLETLTENAPSTVGTPC